MAESPINAALARMRAGEPALGLIVRLARSGEIAHLARASGHDFLFIDRQHGTASLETVSAIALAALGVGVAPLVRVRGHDDPDIVRVLDAGALGVVVPDVATPEQARAAVASCRFPPIGRRSAGAGFAALGYRPVAMAEAAPSIDAATMVVCMIETREGVRNLEAIAAVEGVDVLHLGCNDLLAEMGRPAAFDDPELAETKARLVDACARAGRFAGLGGEHRAPAAGDRRRVPLRDHAVRSGVVERGREPAGRGAPCGAMRRAVQIGRGGRDGRAA